MARMTGKAEFSRLRGRLFASDSRDFERLASPLIRFIAPTAFGAPPLGSVDCAGVDILAWGTKNELLLAVQCKGFKVSEHEIGKDQVEQCQKSVDSFLKSGLRAKKYILLINRYGELAEFRPHVLRILGNLEATGQVDSAQLWDCNKLVSETAKSAKQRVINRIKAPSLNSISDPEIKNVPYKVSDCIIDRHGLKSVVEVSSYVSDPSQELLKIDKGVDSRLILLGEAGYGKTTLASRSNSINGCTFYVRASSLRSVLISKNAFMEQFAFLREIIDDLPQEDADFIEPLMQSAAESVFGTPGIGGLLVIDGLDESVMLSRPGGLQWLFNTLNGFAISVLLTARTEFWQQRIDDFSIPVGERSTKPGAPQRDSRVRLVELRPWGKTQMLSLARMFRDSRYIDEERENIDRFIDLVEKDRYKELYGDIPTRPLFLRYLLETVAESGIQMTGRIALLHEWVRRKIARDYNEPLKHGEGRLSVLDRNEALGVRLELSFRAMVHASAAMSTIVDGALILLPTCLVETALSRDKYFHDVIDPLGLFLNSLLVPVSGIGLSTEMRFAHQVIHEFFLAKHIAGNPSVYSNVKIPANVKQWIIS